MTSKHWVFPIMLALLIVVVSCLSPFAVSAAELIDDLELVDYISDIDVSGDDALVTYKIPLEPHSRWYSVSSNNALTLLGQGGAVNFGQDITTNTYKSFLTSVVLGTFEPVANDANSFYKYERGYPYSDDLKNITHMMFDGVLYEVSVTAETDNYILINDHGDNYSFRGCYFYKDTHFSKPNTLQAWFNDTEEHTIIFGTMVDVTEVVREHDNLRINVWPLGGFGDVFRVIDVSDLKDGANFEFSFSYDFLLQSSGTSGEAEPYFCAFFYDENFNPIGASDPVDFILDEVTDYYIRGTHTGTITVPDGAAYFLLAFDIPKISVKDCTILQFMIGDLEISCSTSVLDANSKSLEVVQNRIDEMQQDISDLKDKLEGVHDSVNDLNQGIQDTNDKLDDIISGGDAGEDLIAGGDKLEDVGSGLGDDLGEIQGFESIYMGQLENNLPDIVAGADLTLIAAPLSFVSDYLNKIVAGVPRQYLVVFTLPMLLGLFLYIVGHPVRAPRPDTSGDTVTRETFTETTILTGRNAGSTTKTRTVTTSQEIGREHNE